MGICPTKAQNTEFSAPLIDKKKETISNDKNESKIYDLEELGISSGDYDVNNLFNILFNDNSINNNDYCLKRIKCILCIYSSWINLKNEEHKDIDDIVDIYDIICSLSIYYNFNDFLRDYKYLITHQNIIDTEFDETESCVENNNIDIYCFIANRQERDRNDYKTDLFFGETTRIKADNESYIKSKATQQILDTCHCYLYHTIRIQTDKIKQTIDNNALNDVSSMDELLKLSYDNVVVEFRKIFNKKRKEVDRYGSNTLRNEHFNKFVTTKVTIKLTETINDEEKNNINEEETICFIDGIMNDMRQHNVDKKVISEFNYYLMDEEYDTDAFIRDIDDLGDDSQIKYKKK
eukprot:552474_1